MEIEDILIYKEIRDIVDDGLKFVYYFYKVKVYVED